MSSDAPVILQTKSGSPAAGAAALRRRRRNVPRPRFEHLGMPRPGSREQAVEVMAGRWSFKGTAPFDVRPPVEWGADPFSDRSWRYTLNAWLFLDPVVHLHATTGDTRALEFAVSVARDWIARATESESGNPFAWHDMGTALRASRLGWIVDAAARTDRIGDEPLADILAAAFRHAHFLAEEGNLSHRHNHGIYQMLGLLSLLRSVPEIDGTGRMYSYACSCLERLYLDTYCETDGMLLEHTPCYHVWLTLHLDRILRDRIVLSRRLERLRDRAMSLVKWLVHPQGHLARFGDCQTQPEPLDARPFGCEVRKRHPSLWYLITRGASGRRPAEGECVLPASGYAFVRGRWPLGEHDWTLGSYLAFAAAFHSGVHKHADDGTIEWSERGRCLLMDAGNFGYQYDRRERRYCESTRAHNTVEVDGLDTSRSQSDAYGSALRRWARKNDTYVFEAFFPDRNGAAHTRTLVFRPGAWLVIVDELSCARPRSFTQWLHFGPDAEVRARGLAAEVHWPGLDEVLHVIPLARPRDLDLRLVRGATEPRLEGWISLSHLKLSPAWAAAFTASGRQVTLACALVLGRRGHAPVQAHTGLLHGFASPARSDRAGSAPGQGG